MMAALDPRADSGTEPARPGPTRTRIAGLAVAVVMLAAISVGMRAFVRAGHGMTQVVYDGIGADRIRRGEQRVQTIDLSMLGSAREDAQRGDVTIRWSGVWFIPRDDLYDLILNADDRVVWTIDDVPAQVRTTGDGV